MAELKTRKIRERWIIEGDLTLRTPASLSNGDDDPTVDLPLLTDPLQGRALLTGASLAGALRSYLNGFGKDKQEPASLLFGGERGDPEGEQSPLIVEDAIGEMPRVELRDGVSIDPTTRTAVDEAKYDRELLAAGTVFPLGFELLIGEDQDDELIQALAQALSALEAGEIRLGGRKRRGLGQCEVRKWRAWRYDLTSPEGLRGWLSHSRRGSEWQDAQVAAWEGEQIRNWQPLRDVSPLPDRRHRLQVEGQFTIDGSVLIRAGFEAEEAPDTTHLRSHRDGHVVPVLSGTSLGGAIRAQALRIARTISPDRKRADQFVNNLFGYMAPPKEEKETRVASRVIVGESQITGSYHDLVQSRVKIDRFTGGAYESALFTEQPVFGGETTLRWEIENPKKGEIGLLLLVLKDLWTGHMTVGGEASVGRGRLQGQLAKINYNKAGEENRWTLARNGNGDLHISGDSPAMLNGFVTDFVSAMGGDS